MSETAAYKCDRCGCIALVHDGCWLPDRWATVKTYKPRATEQLDGHFCQTCHHSFERWLADGEPHVPAEGSE